MAELVECDTIIALLFLPMSATSLSGSCLSFFREQLPLQQYNSWIKPLIFEIDGDKLVLTAPNSFTLRIVQERFLQEISKRALPFFEQPPQIELRIEKRGAKKAEHVVVEPAPNKPSAPVVKSKQESEQTQSRAGLRYIRHRQSQPTGTCSSNSGRRNTRSCL